MPSKLENHTTPMEGTTQIDLDLGYVILAFFSGGLASYNQDLEDFLRLGFLQTEISTVHSGFSVEYSDFYQMKQKLE